MARPRGVVFVVDDARCPIDHESAVALAARIRQAGADPLAARVELYANGRQPERAVPHHEAAVLRTAINEWVDEVGAGQVPASILKLRYRLGLASA